MLIAAGATSTPRTASRIAPFLYAGAEGRNEILKMTLAAGADLKSTNRYGGTALIPAAHHGHVETVKILLATAIDKDHVNNLGWTALLEAVLLGDGGPAHTEIVRLLVEAGANSTSRTAKASRRCRTPSAAASPTWSASSRRRARVRVLRCVYSASCVPVQRCAVALAACAVPRLRLEGFEISSRQWRAR